MPVDGKAALVDIDTPEALLGVKAEIEGAFEIEKPRACARGFAFPCDRSVFSFSDLDGTTGWCRPAPGCGARTGATPMSLASMIE